MKLKYGVILLLSILLILSGCSQSDKTQRSQHQNADKQSHTPYQRIVSLMPSNTEILYELGLKKQLIGVSTVDDYPKDIKKGRKQFDAMNLNKEALLKAKPDLIVAHESQKASSDKVLKALQKNGVKVIYVKDAQSIDEMYQTFKQLGKVTHREQQAEALIQDTKQNIKKVVDSIPQHQRQQEVFLEVSSKPDIYTAGRQTFFNDMLTILHARNSFSSIEGWKAVSKEAIIKKNPDILISTEGISKSEYNDIVKKRGGFNQVKAVKNGRVEVVNGDEVSRPGPRIDEGLKDLKEAIYK
ncbi:ABC transporter substrate-binding protein [Staphylococcus lugdunensis]|uniref:ABC transporter substrate-binding protein n=2 Tax=Staphylococcus lugdunensis TaxID=28035 RepID=A0A133Q0S2_STALU|nr:MULTISPECIES: ABC transporter substrate-binding protein [Staphylococcus]AMG61400.1 Vitamin B12 ABC transporter substrate-binding protein [Staphylococcus lugdunensis]ARB78500.1 ABC transporter substrate-binding protein [Staphylococcus lugdunensis]ARJ12216.1 ABC transporter substrate-binding protein [Staphylococcus lugdunensis]ARJ19626.1 ABC transporter substrate-binding protein [Staphylococcus lugdunensis]ARJ28125.1 ABC transporter substrate-binding protein [Staphylococcus lugdunensis]